MMIDAPPQDPNMVLTSTNLPPHYVLTAEDLDLGELARVVVTVADQEAVLYGEFEVNASLLRDRDPGGIQHHPAALRGIVEDWNAGEDGTVTLSAYAYVHTLDQGSLGMTLPEALAMLNTLRTACLEWAHSYQLA